MAELFRPYRDRVDAPALIDDSGQTSWYEFDERVNRLIHLIRSRGIRPGGRVALLSGSRRELYELFAAAAHAGILVVPINSHFTAAEVRYVLENSASELLVVEPELAPAAAGLAVPQLVLGGPYEEALASSPATEPDDQTMGGAMFYTSGTTGRPKGVTNSALTAGLPPTIYELIAAAMVNIGFPPRGRTLLCGPAYHSAQWAVSFFPFIGGSTVVIQSGFVPEETLELIDRHAVTNLHLVPTQFVRLLAVSEERKAAFSGASLALVLHGAAPCSPAIKREMIDWWGPRITEYYGATEGGFVSLISSEDWLDRPGSVGQPMANMEVRVIADDGQDAPTGEPGVIHIRNLMGTDFEYLGDPDKSAEAHSLDGFFTLGDIGYLDTDGYLFLSDRRIDMIISGGVNIYPAEIEGVLTAHPAVVDAAVFGAPNDEFGEEVRAAVQLSPGQEWSAALRADLDRFVREQVAGYKVPRGWEVVDVMPRSEAGKLLKRQLRAPYWEGSGRTI